MSIIQMSVSAACMIAVVTIIRFTAMHSLPKKLLLLFWAVVLCRLLLPFSVAAETSVFNYADAVIRRLSEISVSASHAKNAEPSLHAMPEIHATDAQEGQAPFTQGGRITVPDSGDGLSYSVAQEPPEPFADTPVTTSGEENALPLTLIWLAGALPAISFFAVSYSRYRRRFKLSQPVKSGYVAAWQARHKLKRPCQVHVSEGISTPLTYGIFRPVIMLPANFDMTDEERLDYVLTHEFIHISRFDALTKLLIAVAVCIHWFNPFVWMMMILYNRDIEISCDESVIKAVGAGRKTAYALVLIEMAEKGNKPAFLFSGFSRHAIEDRVKSIVKLRKPSVAATLAAAIIIVGTIAVFATSALGGTETIASLETSAAWDADATPAFDSAEDLQADDMAEAESAGSKNHEPQNEASAEIIVPMDMDELNSMFDFSKLGTLFSPESLHSAGGSLLFDEHYGFSVQFPKEWTFKGSAASIEETLALYAKIAENPAAFAEIIRPEDFSPLEETELNFPAVFYKNEFITEVVIDYEFLGVNTVSSVLTDNTVSIYYRNFSLSLTSFEAARLGWANHYARIIGIGGAASHLGGLEAIDLNGADAYRFSIRIDFSEYGGSFRLEHEYLIPISDNVFAVFNMALSDTDADDAEFEKFHRAMETFALM